MTELEAELRQTRSERDELRVRVAKLEGETEVLRAMLLRKVTSKVSKEGRRVT